MTRAQPTATQSQVVLLLVAALRLTLGLAINILLARLLAPQDFGFFVFVAVVITVANEISDFGTGNIAARQIARYPHGERSVLQSVITWRLLAGVILACIVLPFAFHERDSQRRAILLATGVALPLLAPAGIYPAFQVRQRQGKPALAILTSYILFLLGILFRDRLRLHGASLAWLVLARELFYVLALGFSGWALLGYFPFPGNLGPGFRALLAMAAFYGGAGILHNLYFYADVFLVKMIRGESELGAYAASFRLINPFMTLPWILVAPLVPVLSARGIADKSALAALTSDALAMALGLGGIAAAVGIVMAPDLISLLYHGQYLGGALSTTASFAWLSLALGMALVTPLVVSTLLAIDRERSLLALAAVGFLVNVGCNLLVIPRFGFTAAAVVTALTELAVCAGAISLAAMAFSQPIYQPKNLRLLLPGAIAALILHFIKVPAPVHVASAIGLCAVAATIVLCSSAARRLRKSLAEESPTTPLPAAAQPCNV